MKRSFFFIGLTALLVFASCKSKKETKKEDVKFLVTNPIQQDTIIKKNYVCQIHSIRHIELRALEKGYLQDVFVDEGSYVKKGQRMFQIMPKVYQADLLKAKAELNVAAIELKNTESLASNNVVSLNELAMVKAKYQKAKAEVALAETHLGFANIRAPFSGIMDHLHARKGSLLDKGQLLTSISDNSKMWVYFNVPEAQYLNYIVSKEQRANTKVELLMANNKIFDQTGIIKTIEGEFNNKTGNIAFRATFPNPDAILRHGETGNVIMTVPLKNALMIPQKATFSTLNQIYVYVVGKEDHIVRQKEIHISAELPNLFVVDKGLKVTDQVLLEGIRKVRDQEKTDVRYEDPKTVFSHLTLYAE